MCHRSICATGVFAQQVYVCYRCICAAGALQFAPRPSPGELRSEQTTITPGTEFVLGGANPFRAYTFYKSARCAVSACGIHAGFPHFFFRSCPFSKRVAICITGTQILAKVHEIQGSVPPLLWEFPTCPLQKWGIPGAGKSGELPAFFPMAEKWHV